MTIERDNPGNSRVLFGTRSGRSARLVAIVGIAIGALTTLIGFISFVFAITGEGEVMLVGWLSLVWDGDSSGAVVLGGIATAPPAVVLAVCL